MIAADAPRNRRAGDLAPESSYRRSRYQLNRWLAIGSRSDGLRLGDDQPVAARIVGWSLLDGEVTANRRAALAGRRARVRCRHRQLLRGRRLQERAGLGALLVVGE
jgi:hypothetical protein